MSQSKQSIGVALLGCGTVGGGVLRLVHGNAVLAARVGATLDIRHVLVRDASKARVPECRPEWVTTDPNQVFDDPDVEVVVEVMGGEVPAKGYIERAIASGKSVVTANKFLLAKHGTSLLRAAVDAGVDVAFEASVGGGIPLIRTLREALTSDSVSSIVGILNGTCNYILTRMKREGLGFEAILKDAQALGYAEADPSMDVDGHDAAQKLVVLSMLAFGAEVEIGAVAVEGIRDIDQLDFRFAERFGYVIKHLAIGAERGDRLELRVHPALVPTTSVLANIHDVLNGALIVGAALGPCLLTGPGAGALPTAVSVVADMVEVARARLADDAGRATRGIQTRRRPLVPMADVRARYYLRFAVEDQSGVLARIMTSLGDRGVSVEQMMQQGQSKDLGEAVDVLIITHTSSEGGVREAMREIAAMPSMRRPPRLIRILET